MTERKRGGSVPLGTDGERRTALYLEKKGYRIMRYNYRCRFGEIDLIAFDPTGEILCFVEVKTRSGVEYGRPCEAVTCRKRRHIRKTAFHFLVHHPVHFRTMRLDVAEVLCLDGRFYIRYLENIPV